MGKPAGGSDRSSTWRAVQPDRFGLGVRGHVHARSAINRYICLVGAGIAGEDHSQGWHAREGRAELKGERYVSAALAGDHVSPAGGHGESLLAGVQAQVCGGGEGVDRVRIEILVVQGNALPGVGLPVAEIWFWL